MRSIPLIAAGLVLAVTSVAFAAPPTGPAMRHPSGLVTPGGPDGIDWKVLTNDGAKRAGSRHPSGLVTLPDEDELDEAARVMPFLVDAIAATTTAISHSWAPGNWYDPEPNPSPQRSKGADPEPVEGGV